ncbi:MAG: extracellular solute-binding protein [Amaricoccus sp.]
MKNILKAAVATAALIVSAGFASADPQKVVWWDFLGGGDGVRMKALIADFNKENPDIQIDATTLEWGVPFYTKVRTSAAVGQGPDVMTYHLSRIPIALDEKVLSPITDEDLANAGLAKTDFFPRSIEAASDNGQLYAVPFDIHAFILYYNKKVLEGTPWLGADGNITGINNVDDFTAMLKTLKDKGVETPLSVATGNDATMWRLFATLFAQEGGQFIVGNEVLPGDNTDKAVKALKVISDWREAGYIPEQTEYPASIALFSAGGPAFHMNGVWEVPTFTDQAKKGTLGFDWSATVIPTLMGEPATWADSHAFAIPQQPTPMDPAKRKAVMEVIGWMEKHAIRWADAGHIPAYLPVATSAEYKAMMPNAQYAPLAEHAAYDPRSKIAGVASPVYDAAANIMVPAINGMLSPEDAVQQIKDQLQPLLN